MKLCKTSYMYENLYIKMLYHFSKVINKMFSFKAMFTDDRPDAVKVVFLLNADRYSTLTNNLAGLNTNGIQAIGVELDSIFYIPE